MANVDYSPVSNDIATGAVSVSAGADADLARVPCRGVYVGTTGNLKVTMASGDVVTYPSLPVGFHPISCSRIWLTGTTASNIIAMY